MTEKTNKHTTIINTLNQHQAHDITVLDVHKATTLTDTMIICSGNSSRHTLALKNYIVETIKKQHPEVSIPNIEGENTGEWVLMDYQDIIVHIMLPETRSFYNIEQLWQGLINQAEAS